MTIQEFRDVVDGVADARRSLQSCQPSERDAEACRVQGWVRQLRECQWPSRLSGSDRQRALLVMENANAEVAT